MKISSEQRAICGLCPEGCWVRVHVRDGKLVSVMPDSDPSYGNLCRRGRFAPQIVYSEDRIRTPLLRTGPKGTRAFRTASWDEALDWIAEKLIKIKKVYGARAIASYMGAGTLEDSVTDFYSKILSPFGSPNDMDCGSLCYVSSRILAPATTMGIHGSHLNPDFENADVIIIWGTNPMKDGLPEKRQRIESAGRRGARIVVIDPRRTVFAQKADLWIPVRPGTDGALALALINSVIGNGSYDKEFVTKWTAGFEPLRDYASAFTTEKTSVTCGISAESIVKLGRMIAAPARVTVDFYSGVEYAPSGTQTGRAIYSLTALLGNLDEKGGLCINNYPHNSVHEYTADPENPALGADKYPLFFAVTGKAHISGLADAVLRHDPYPVHSLLLIGGSPLLSHTDPETWRRVYDKLDFMVLADRFMTAEARWADVILPAATYYEMDSYQIYRNRIRVRHKIIEPVGEAKSDADILASLTDRLGYGHLFPGSANDRIRTSFKNLQAADTDIAADLIYPEPRTRKYESGHLRMDGRPGFPTESGKFEFASSLLAKYGYDPLPVYIHPYQLAAEGSKLVLTTGARSVSRFNSQYLDRPELGVNNPVLEINPADAGKRGISGGDTVILRTGCGEVSLIANVTNDIREGTVHAPSGGGGEHQIGLWSAAHVNSLIPPGSQDPISGYPAFKAQLCEVNSPAIHEDAYAPASEPGYRQDDMLMPLS